MQLEREGILSEVWRIGSECGPTLHGVSQELWAGEMKSVQRRLRLAQRVQSAMTLEGFRAEKEELAASILTERLPGLLAGMLTERQVKHLGGVTGSMLTRLARKTAPDE